MSVKFESAKALADRMDWPESRVRKLIASNQLRHIRIGKTVYVPEGAIEEFLDAHMVQPHTGRMA